MRRSLLPFFLFALILSGGAFAATPDGSRPRHLILTLAPGTTAADLAAEGVAVQRMLPGGRALALAAGDSEIESDPHVLAAEPFDASKKLFSSARRQAGAGRAFATLNIAFHDDVSFDAAQQVIASAGGQLDTPLAVGFDGPHQLRARIPSAVLAQLAEDDAVLAVTGQTLSKKSANSVAAQLSHVTPLFTAPYNLDGSGVVLSAFELSPAAALHREFGGRLTLHFSGTGDQLHATHVSGTMIAAGIDPRAKGMAPAATMHLFNAGSSDATFTAQKEGLGALGVVADNNSWDYNIGWQLDPDSFKWVWYGATEEFGAYDPNYSTPYEKTALTPGEALLVHAAGNDAANGHPSLSGPWFAHFHTDCTTGKLITSETFCYSANGSGTDCPTGTCSAGISTKVCDDFGNLLKHCETDKHPAYGPANTVGLISSIKNSVSVGAVDADGHIGYFSSQGPTRDGRIKPELVAKGLSQYSTAPPSTYTTLDGTSMSTPVVTGISALLVQQWRKTLSGATPTAPVLKALLIAGAVDLGNPGPDYVYGFGLVDAKNSVDLIIANGTNSARVRTGTIGNNEDVHIPMTVSATQNVRVVLTWFDPDVTPSADDIGGKTLLNDLDLRVVGPNGTTLPYVLDPNNPGNNATRGVNSTDTTEEVEITNAPPGTYDVIVHGAIGDVRSSTQSYVVVANAQLGTTTPPLPPGPRRRSVRHN
jgi:hypothetical protein